MKREEKEEIILDLEYQKIIAEKLIDYPLFDFNDSQELSDESLQTPLPFLFFNPNLWRARRTDFKV